MDEIGVELPFYMMACHDSYDRQRRMGRASDAILKHTYLSKEVRIGAS